MRIGIAITWSRARHVADRHHASGRMTPASRTAGVTGASSPASIKAVAPRFRASCILAISLVGSHAGLWSAWDTALAAGPLDDRKSLVIRGRVRDAEGFPIETARVRVEGTREVSTRTDPSGNYTLTVPLGTAGTLLHHPLVLKVGARSERWRLALPNGDRMLVLQVGLEPGGSALHCVARSNDPRVAAAAAGIVGTRGEASGLTLVNFIGVPGKDKEPVAVPVAGQVARAALPALLRGGLPRALARGLPPAGPAGSTEPDPPQPAMIPQPSLGDARGAADLTPGDSPAGAGEFGDRTTRAPAGEARQHLESSAKDKAPFAGSDDANGPPPAVAPGGTPSRATTAASARAAARIRTLDARIEAARRELRGLEQLAASSRSGSKSAGSVQHAELDKLPVGPRRQALLEKLERAQLMETVRGQQLEIRIRAVRRRLASARAELERARAAARTPTIDAAPGPASRRVDAAPPVDGLEPRGGS